MTRDVVVVGGGIAGASVAAHLAPRSDGRVLVLERSAPGAATTARSVGQFGFYGSETDYRMKRYGMGFYNELLRHPRTAPRYALRGMLMVATEPGNAERLRRAVGPGGDADVGYLAEGVDRDPVEYLPGSDLQSSLLVPPLDAAAVEAALYRPRVGYLTPSQRLAEELLERAREDGATVRTNTAVAEVTATDGRVTGVETDDGTAIEADAVVCAAGPWNAALAASAGVDLPVAHERAPVLRLRPAEPLPYDVPAVKHLESPFTFHARRRDEVLVSYNPGLSYADSERIDPDDVDDEVPPDVRADALAFLDDLLPGLPALAVDDEWVGVASRTPDGNPILGWTDVAGLAVVAFDSSGIQLAPAAGDVVAGQLLDGDRSPYHDATSIVRFDGHDAVPP